jgi:hypothetical protein
VSEAVRPHDGARIVQAFPADGWRAVFLNEDADGPLLFTSPLVGWAIPRGVDDDDRLPPPTGGSFAAGLHADVGDGYAALCDARIGGFIGYVGPGQDALTLYGDLAREMRARRGRPALTGAGEPRVGEAGS